MRSTVRTLKRARTLRKQMSLPEVMLWKRLRGREDGKPVFRRQHPIGPYVLDFFCARARLCVEIDGDGHGHGGRPQQDHRRDIFLVDQGIRTIRVPASSVLQNADGVADRLIQIAQGLSAPSTASRSPSPARTAGEAPR